MLDGRFFLVVSGWRNATHDHHGDFIADKLGVYRDRYGSHVTLRHGRCKYGGVDLIADQIGRQWGWEIEAWPADEVDGRILGSLRNRNMCQAQPRADELAAFPAPNSSGTVDCLKWAIRLLIPAQVWPLQAGTATTARSSAHDCPGECGRPVPVHLFACRTCWGRLPHNLKTDILRSHRTRATNPTAHRAAMAAATTWFREQRHG